VLGGGKSKTGRVSLPIFPPYALERIDLERLQPAPCVEIIARDAFVADISIKLDQLQREIRSLARELDLAKGEVATVREDADRNNRFLSFQETEQRARAHKVDEMLRRFKDFKARIDGIDSKGTGNCHSCKDDRSINRCLTEIGALQRQFRNVERNLKFSAGLFCGSVLLWLVTLLSG